MKWASERNAGESNAVVHGNRLDAHKLVHVRCRCKVGKGISLIVSDQGQGFEEASMESQERIGTWCTWGIILLSWIGFFLVLALMVRATGCNRSSEAGTQSMDIVAESAGLEARTKNRPLQRVQQGNLSSQPVSLFGSKRRDRPMVTGSGFRQRDS